MIKLIIIILIFALTFNFNLCHPRWFWRCVSNLCMKLPWDEYNPNSPDYSFTKCQMLCHHDALFWPKPKKKSTAGNESRPVDITKITYNKLNSSAGNLLAEAMTRFLDMIKQIQPADMPLKPEGLHVHIKFFIKNSSNISFTLKDTSEAYELKSVMDNNNVKLKVGIKAKTFYGARHGLETFAQVFFHNEITNRIEVMINTDIKDKPAYPYRGLMLDTGRNYFSVKSLKRTLEGMALSKLNTLHWHITDTHSFPIVLPSRPELARWGAFSSKKVYTVDDIKELVHYAKVRGIRIIPEIDTPSHVGEGWQKTGFLECFKREPFSKCAPEPPCGLLNPTKNGLYDLIEDIYKDLLDLFDPEMFHVGADEVGRGGFNCWQSNPEIVKWMKQKHMPLNTNGFLQLWHYYQTTALAKLDGLNKSGKKLPIILWNGPHYTHYEKGYINNSRHIVQVWYTGDLAPNAIADLLKNDFEIILSPYQVFYLDCGLETWFEKDHRSNWCQPFKGWRRIYDYRISNETNSSRLVLGGEVALWTEQVDESSLDNRLWPRTASLAERLWTNPSHSYRKAERRMLVHKERLQSRGIQADSVQTEWCMQNEGFCHGRPII